MSVINYNSLKYNYIIHRPTMKKIFFSMLILLGVLFTTKVLLHFMAEDYLTKLFKQKIELQEFSFYPFDIRTNSLGGKTKLNYKNDNFVLSLKNVSLINFENINKKNTRKKMIVKDGEVSGTLKYNPLTQIWLSDLRTSNLIINGIDLDKKLLFFNDLLGFNIVSLFRNFLKNIDKSNKTTKITHLQFSTSMHNNLISLDDVALSSQNFRIVLVGDVYVKGKIKFFEVHLVDPNGCSIISQELTGDLRDPNMKKIKTFEKIAKAVPASMFSTGMKMATFTTNNLDSVLPLNKSHISRQFLSKGDIIFKKTSKIILNQNCKKVYSGEVKHPSLYAKGFI